MRKFIIFLWIILISVVAFNSEVYSHSGRTNGDGCHNDYVNGGYHCHNGNSSNGGNSSGNWNYNGGTSNNDSSQDFPIMTIVIVSLLGIFAFFYFNNNRKKK